MELGVELEDPVEVAAGVDDDPGAHGVARDRRTGATHRQRHLLLARDRQDRCDLVGMPRMDDDLGHHAVERGVGGVQRAGQRRGLAEEARELEHAEDAQQPQHAHHEQRLRTGQQNVELLYEALKAYIMLSDPRYFDDKALKAFVTAEWESSLPREVTIEQRRELESHLDRLLALGDIASARLLYESAAAGGSGTPRSSAVQAPMVSSRLVVSTPRVIVPLC